MNQFDLWRYFGNLPEVPETAYTLSPDRAISALGRNPLQITALFSLAMRFSRLDSLNDILSNEDWSDSPEGLLNRGRLRLYRALAEKPDNPDPELLNEAAVEFRRATESLGSSSEALAGLVRIHALMDGIPSALKQLRRLERIGGKACRQAAAGAALFLAGRAGWGTPAGRRLLKRARRHLLLSGSKSGRKDSSELIRIKIDFLLGYQLKALKRLGILSAKGNLDARLLQLQIEVEDFHSGKLSSFRTDIMEDIAGYRRLRPSDPGSFVVEGDLLKNEDEQSAHTAWRTALVLDERCSEAWLRLGQLYKKAWRESSDSFRDTWLEAAEDSFLKALTLNPLNASCRLALGVIERESGNPARAVSTLIGGLALNPYEPEFRRQIAVCWNDLAQSAELSASASAAAAARARIEWEALLEMETRQASVIFGLLHSIALEGSENSQSVLLMVELLSKSSSDDTGKLANLAEVFIRKGLKTEAGILLNFISRSFPESSNNPWLKAAWARLKEGADSLESMKLYAEALTLAGPDVPEYVDWLLSASEMAADAGLVEEEEALLNSGLKHHPENLLLNRRLAEKLFNEERVDEALDVYQNALGRSPQNQELLEDAVWFFRSAGVSDLAGKILNRYLAENPEDGRIWNQLGVHYMEIGWDDDSGRMMRDLLESAVKAYREAVELSPENMVFAGNLGDALRQIGRIDEAEELLEKAVEGGSGSSEDAFSFNSLGRLKDERSYLMEGSESSSADWESSGKLYRLAAERGKGNADYQRDYAWWLYRERRLEEAADFYRRAAQADPEDVSLPYGEFFCFKEMGDETEALKAINRALLLSPSDPGILADKADLLGSLGKRDAGKTLYSEILEITGNTAWIWERLAEYCNQRMAEEELSPGDVSVSLNSVNLYSPEKLIRRELSSEGVKWRCIAFKAWENAFNLEPENRGIRVGYAAILAAEGYLERAENLLKKTAGSVEALNLLGRIELYRFCKEDDEKLLLLSGEHLSAALRGNPENPSYHADIANLFYLEGQRGKALESFRQAADRAPGNSVYAANAGICAYSSGLFEEAAAYLRRALSSDDDEAEWQNVLGLSLLAAGSPDSALDAFRKASLSDPESDIYSANLAMAHESIHAPSDTLQ